MSPFARYLAIFFFLPAGIIGAAALGSAGMANAATAASASQPGVVLAPPTVKAHPAPDAKPGYLWHHGVYHLADLQPSYTR